MLTTFDVVGFGALNVDKLFQVDRIARKDEESSILKFKESCGGSAANTIVGLARLEHNVGFVGKVGGDREGQLLVDNLRKEQVDINGVIVAKSGKSGVVMGFVDEEGERALYVAPGVNDTISLGEIRQDYLKQARLIHMTSFVGEAAFKTQKKIIGQLPEHIKVSFDPGLLYSKRGQFAMRSILERSNIFLPNEVELKLLTGKNYKEGAKMLIEKGAEIVGIKLGKKGCFVMNRNESHFIKSFKVKAVDTTGAGDAWNAGFLYGLLNNKNLEESGRIGNFVASKCITKIGARRGLPQLPEINY
ncbi:MAG: carbohydrate kinase family protein [Candidatus Bathyarchaeota archaeon]|nr:MAG: carbohydrate kinase family protein [Candidatus Bathyarchaeota archaeon]